MGENTFCGIHGSVTGCLCFMVYAIRPQVSNRSRFPYIPTGNLWVDHHHGCSLTFFFSFRGCDRKNVQSGWSIVINGRAF